MRRMRDTRHNAPATPTNPRITPQAKAEHALLQQLALKLGQTALEQHNIPYTPTHQLPAGGTLATVDHTQPNDTPLQLQVTVTVTINPHTTAATNITSS